MLDLSSLTLHMPASLTDTFRLLDLCGVLLNGILGGLIARRKNFDLVASSSWPCSQPPPAASCATS